jgi:hypothetical protein
MISLEAHMPCSVDPEFMGFKPLEDSRELPKDVLMKGRRLHFKEAEEISHKFLSDLTANRRQHYHDKKEFRETMMMGAAFLIVTCFVDWYVCTV